MKNILVSVTAITLVVAFSTQAMGRDYITVVGSSTVFPFATTVAENFGRTTSFKTPKIESTGWRARFATKLRNRVGKPPIAYLEQWRVGVAQWLLRQGKSVHLVADEVGYANASALSGAFAARAGVSPAQWRRKAW